MVVDGRPVAIDDLFLWSRLHDRPRDTVILDAVRAGRFDAIVAEADLAHLDQAPLFERQRWHASLVEAVLSRYRFSRRAGPLYVYEPARP